MSASFIVYPSGKDWYEVTSRISFDTTKSDTKGIKISKGLTASDFIITESPALGTDFHKLWREEDGSLNTHGFAMLTKESKYAGFSSDGGACGARFGAGTEFVTPENAAAIMAAALSESTVPTATSTPQPTAASTPLPAATDTPAPTLIPSATSESAEILPTWSVVVLLVIIATAVVAIVLIVKKVK